ncbi:thiamine pyrophosphate-dependent dehydrogenase E1 component subunit alpha [Actinomycetota bacterium]|nr:thiamine pyrophosphate-dependent dehydrogenase E1 component subunit alpha [Actinomycetota bacterium]
MNRSPATSLTGKLETTLFRQMLRIRRVEEAIADRYPEQEMRTPVHLCVGQEATPVGVSEHLDARDKVMSGHRSHGHYLAKGGDLRAMLAEIYGRETGCSRGKGGSQHLVDLDCGFLGSAPILASTLSIGVGVAWALKQQGTDGVVVVYFGDGATEEGVFHESVSFAALHSLPVLFVCENNLYSVHSSLSVRQPARPISDMALAYGIPGITCDGNNVLSVSEVAAEAVSRARMGLGPSLLVFDTYRWLEHVGPGSDLELGYRSAEELDRWKSNDPLQILRLRCRAKVTDWETVEQQLEVEIAEEIIDAFSFARNSPFPHISEMLTDVFPSSDVTP